MWDESEEFCKRFTSAVLDDSSFFDFAVSLIFSKFTLKYSLSSETVGRAEITSFEMYF
jgi:hypothetical protein